MTTQLPFHPTAVHPHTGLPIRAIAVRPGHEVKLAAARAAGRAKTSASTLLDAMLVRHYLFPMMGASPDDDGGDGDKDKGGGSEDKDGDKDKGGDQPPQRQPGVPPNYAIDGNGASLGYPVETPVAQMKPEEQAAYHRVQGRKHEQRNKQWSETVGNRTPEQVKADLERLAELDRKNMTEQERAVADARQEGRTEVITTASRKLAEQFFDVSLAHVPEERRTVLLENVDVAKVVKADGTIDTDKVKQISDVLAPKSDKDNRDPDYGGGRHGSSSSTGVSAGRTAYQERQQAKRGRRTAIKGGSDKD